MLDYSTCLKLKEAGFPQDLPDPSSYYHSERLFGWSEGEDLPTEYTKCPTLSELIEACGLKVQDFDLERRFNGFTYWSAILWKDGRYSQGRGEGDSPEEAVANLWLVINIKPQEK